MFVLIAYKRLCISAPYGEYVLLRYLCRINVSLLSFPTCAMFCYVEKYTFKDKKFSDNHLAVVLIKYVLLLFSIGICRPSALRHFETCS